MIQDPQSDSQCEGPRANASPRLPTPRCAKLESAYNAIFRATVQLRSRSVVCMRVGLTVAPESGAYTVACVDLLTFQEELPYYIYLDAATP
jgi:hypothetical protein